MKSVEQTIKIKVELPEYKFLRVCSIYTHTGSGNERSITHIAGFTKDGKLEELKNDCRSTVHNMIWIRVRRTICQNLQQTK